MIVRNLKYETNNNNIVPIIEYSNNNFKNKWKAQTYFLKILYQYYTLKCLLTWIKWLTNEET